MCCSQVFIVSIVLSVRTNFSQQGWAKLSSFRLNGTVVMETERVILSFMTKSIRGTFTQMSKKRVRSFSGFFMTYENCYLFQYPLMAGSSYHCSHVGHLSCESVATDLTCFYWDSQFGQHHVWLAPSGHFFDVVWLDQYLSELCESLSLLSSVSYLMKTHCSTLQFPC